MVKKFLPFLIIIVLLVLFGIGIALAKYLPDTFNNNDIVSPTKFSIDNDDFAAKIRNAAFSLETDSTLVVHNVGDTINLKLMLNTEQWQIVGVDAIINYPANLVEVTEIKVSDTFDNYPLAIAENGTIKISGLKKIGETVNGKYVVAEMTLLFKDSGNASFEFDYQPFVTNESNIVENKSGEDLLGIVNNISFKIN